MHVITIVARNYLPYARVLMDSLRTYNPEAIPWVLVVDGPADPGTVPGARFITPADLPLPADTFARMRVMYDVTELSTALKPFAMASVLDAGAPAVTYLDPDIQVFHGLGFVVELAESHGVVLTPHTTDPLPRDGLLPQEHDLLAAGAYNLGFISVSQVARPMLEWWQERLAWDAVSDPERNLFTDQRWIDLVPSLFPCYLLRDPGCNVAYWNLGPRVLEHGVDGRIHVNGEPLKFFHFSGFRLDKPWLLSKYTAERPRARLSDDPVLARLCHDYAAAVRGTGLNSSVEYGFARLDDEVPLTPRMRRIYREAFLDAEELGGDPPPLPDDRGSLTSWFREPLVPGHPVTRAAFATWLRRRDLRGVYPDPWGSDADSLARWARERGEPDGEFPAVLATPVSAQPAEVDGLIDAEGVNLFGYLQAELGLGTLARAIHDAVEAAGVPAATVASTRTRSRQQARFQGHHTEPVYPVDIVVVNADQMPAWARDSRGRPHPGRWTIGVWAWELPDFPRHLLPALDLVDEVWAISAFVRDAISPHTSKPVRVVPLHVKTPGVAAQLDRDALGIPAEEDYFLFTFDYLSEMRRKNPDGLIEAYSRAFPVPGSGPALVIKSINGHLRPGEREHLRYLASARPDVVLVEDYLSEEQLQALTSEALGYVSLHRSEGFGLTLAEAMAAGTPVVATAWSGNLDFMAGHDLALVPYRLVPVDGEAGPYSDSVWAEPDLDAAAALMRRLALDSSFRGALTSRGRRAVESALSLQRAASWVRASVAEAAAAAHARSVPAADLEESGSSAPDQYLPPSAVALAAGRAAVDHARLLAASRVPPEASHSNVLAPGVRKVVGRVLATHDLHTEHQLMAALAVDDALLSAVRSVGNESAAALADAAARIDRDVDNRMRSVEDRLARIEVAMERVATSLESYASYLHLVRQQDE